jgi:ribosome-binding protein aMBF1 (putative translation factor)
VATSIMTPPSTATEHLLAELRAARGWQHRALAEATETAVNDIARWSADDLDALNPDHRRQVEAVLSVDSTLPWWTRAHA